MSHLDPEDLRQSAERELEELQSRDAPLKPKERLKIPLQDMPHRDPDERRCSMDEVAIGYTREQAVVEAMRCLQCKNAPCIDGCPVSIDIPGFIAALAEEDFGKSIDILKQSSLLPAVCGRVCPQESQCQATCTVGKALKDVDQSVAIGRLERFAADWERTHGEPELPEIKPATGKRVAVVGSGPASITVAADVRREGHAVTMFEAFHKTGGVLLYGIPEFRLPKSIVQEEIDALETMGVEIVPNFVVGRTRKLLDLMEHDGYDAIFIGSGAGLPRFLDIPGENLVGVFSANEYLTRANLMRAFDREMADTPIFHAKSAAIIGGGNVAMDAARMALRLGVENVHLVYRRTEAEMPARAEEIEHAREEGVQFHFLQNPTRILDDGHGNVRGIECLHYELGEPDDSGRRRPVAIAGSEFTMDLGLVIVAVGNTSNPLVKQTTPGLEVTRRGTVKVDENGQTSIPGVFAGGDIVLGAATVILAMGQGRKVAASINRMLASPTEEVSGSREFAAGKRVDPQPGDRS
jgi:glutamate synthase (NADPH/NADH) small chain